jgi:hypothetical protein
MQDTRIRGPAVYFLAIFLVHMNKSTSASSIAKVQLADRPMSQNSDQTAIEGQTSEDLVPSNRTVEMSLGALAANASSRPKSKTVTALSSTQTQSRHQTHGSCRPFPYRITLHHAVSSTVTCSRRVVVNMCLGYCKSYTAPLRRKAKVNCLCCRGKTTLIKVPLHCGDSRVIKHVPTVDKCHCRPCSSTSA